MQRKELTLMEYTREQAVASLMAELEKGWKSGEEEGWLSAEDVRAHFAARRHNEDGRNLRK